MLSATFLAGAARNDDGNTDPTLHWVNLLNERFNRLVAAQRQPGGPLADQSVFQNQYGVQWAASLDHGNFFSIAKACRALP